MSEDYLQARRAQFEDRYRRPMPWYDTLDPEDLGDLVWKASERLRLGSTGRLERLQLAVHERVRWLEMFTTRQMSAAFRQMGIPVTGTAIIADWGGRRLLRIGLKDLLEFWEVLASNDDFFILDEDGRWIVLAHHDGEVGGLVASRTSVL